MSWIGTHSHAKYVLQCEIQVLPVTVSVLMIICRSYRSLLSENHVIGKDLIEYLSCSWYLVPVKDEQPDRYAKHMKISAYFIT